MDKTLKMIFGVIALALVVINIQLFNLSNKEFSFLTKANAHEGELVYIYQVIGLDNEVKRIVSNNCTVMKTGFLYC